MDETDSRILIKKIGPAPHIKMDMIELEIELTQKASDLTISPKVLYTKTCVENGSVSGYIVLEKVDGYPLERPTESQLEEIKRILIKLNTNGIYHGDIHSGNFIFGSTKSHPQPRVWLIDYGESKHSTDQKNSIDWDTWRLVSRSPSPEQSKASSPVSPLDVVKPKPLRPPV